MVWDRDFRAGTIAPQPGTGTLIRAIKNWSGRMENDVRREIASASIFPQATYLAAIRPMVSFTSEDLQGCAAYLPFGTCITFATSGIDAWGQKQSCAGVVGGSTDIRYRINNGVLVPRTLSVNHQGLVQVSWEVYARWDGTNAILTKTTSAPPASGVQYRRHQLYSARVAGNTLEGIRSISVDFQPQVVTESADNVAAPTVVSVTSFMPRITLQGVDPFWFDLIGTAGVECTFANTLFQFKEFKTAIGQNVHVRLNATGIATCETLLDANNSSPAQSSVVIDCGTTATDNVPLQFVTNTTLT